MLAALDSWIVTADLAEGLPNLGVPFRETHRISERCTAKSEELGIAINGLILEQWKAMHSRFPDNSGCTQVLDER
jgi:argininosuccinate lyase